MKPAKTTSYNIACKWLSVCLILVAVYYWLLTTGVVFFSRSLFNIAPRQTMVYRSFFRQNWRLFAVTKVYNRQMNFIVRDKQNIVNADTTDLVQYILAKKRKYAPFNNLSEALDRILYEEMNKVEMEVIRQKKKVKDSLPGAAPAFYFQLACKRLQEDSRHQQSINNIVAYAKYVMQQEKKSMAGKEFQLKIVHTYIAPAKPTEPSVPGGNERVVFISSYKSF